MAAYDPVKKLGPVLIGCCAHLGYLSCSRPLGWPWGSVLRRGFWGMEDPPSLTGSPMSLLMPSLHFIISSIIRIDGGVLILSLQLLVKSQFSEIAETK